MDNDRILDPYYAGLEQFREAMTARDYELAAQVLALTLRELETTALSNFVPRFGLIPSVPVVQAAGVAVAALYPSPDVAAAFDRLSHDVRLQDQVQPNALPDATELVGQIKSVVSEEPGLDRKQLRARINPKDGRLFGNLVTYLVKAQFLFEREGTYSTVERAPQPVAAPEPGFRAGQKFVEPPIVRLFEHALLGKEAPDQGASDFPTQELTEGVSVTDDSAVITDTGDRYPAEAIPVDRRRRGKAQTVVLRSSTWLLRYTRPASATEDQYTADILDNDGILRRTITFDHAVKRTFSHPDADFIAVLDSRARVLVLREDGELLDIVHLAGSPELEAQFEEFAAASGSRPSRPSLVRSFDVNQRDGTLLFSMTDRVWCFRYNGEPVWSHQMPKVPPNRSAWDRGDAPDAVRQALSQLSLPETLSPRQVASYLETTGESEGLTNGRHFAFRSRRSDPAAARSLLRSALGGGGFVVIMGSGINWIEAASFTSTGATMSTFDGLNVDVDHAGVVIRTWLSPATFNPVLERPDVTIGWARNTLLSVATHSFIIGDLDAFADPVKAIGPVLGHVHAIRGKVVAVSARTVSIGDERGETLLAYRTPKPVTAVYPAAECLVIEMGNLEARLPL